MKKGSAWLTLFCIAWIIALWNLTMNFCYLCNSIFDVLLAVCSPISIGGAFEIIAQIIIRGAITFNSKVLFKEVHRFICIFANDHEVINIRAHIFIGVAFGVVLDPHILVVTSG